jgi:hypothetical protein
MALEMYPVYLYFGKKDFYCICSGCCVISVLFSTKFRLCHVYLLLLSFTVYFLLFIFYCLLLLSLPVYLLLFICYFLYFNVYLLLFIFYCLSVTLYLLLFIFYCLSFTLPMLNYYYYYYY